MKRIGIIQIWQESASFNPVMTEIDNYVIFTAGANDKDIIKVAAESNSEVSGFLDCFKSWSEPVEPVIILLAKAWPGGPLSSTAKAWFLETIGKGLESAGLLDGILVSLHGALMAKDDDDVEGLLLERIRNFVAYSDIPLVATVDLHAYITAKMLANTNAIVGYQTNPHFDLVDTGRRAGNLLKRIYEGATPALGLIRLPMIVSGESTQTESDILKPVFKRMLEIESADDVLSTNIIMAQPYIDVPDLGWIIMVYTDSDHERSHQLSTELAEMCWEKRNLLANEFEFYPPQQCISKALETRGKPVVIADGADSMNSGSPGDSIHLLKAMMNRKIPQGALTIMVDPDAVALAQKAGEGGNFDFAVGGKRDNVFSKPLKVSGKVLFLKPAKYIYNQGHAASNSPVDMGTAAAVKVGDVVLLLTEKAGPGGTPQMYRCVGLEPKNFKIVIVKSPAGFRPEFEPFAASILLSECPGCSNPNLSELPYKKISRPLWPLDEIDRWQSVKWCQPPA